jgi:hypothetical protein
MGCADAGIEQKRGDGSGFEQPGRSWKAKCLSRVGPIHPRNNLETKSQTPNPKHQIVTEYPMFKMQKHQAV